MKGATFRVVSASRATFYFNPRTHEGCDDQIGNDVAVLFAFQSTHP